MKRSALAAYLSLHLSAMGAWGATSAHYVMPVGAITSGGGAAASANYRQFSAPGPEEAAGISASLSRNQLAGLLGFLWGRPATVPEAPTLTGVYAGNQMLRLLFAPPAYNGGTEVMTYLATCTPSGGSPISATGTTSPIIVTGLANGLTYGCTVSARNAVGDGPASTLLSRIVRPANLVPIMSILLE